MTEPLIIEQAKKFYLVLDIEILCGFSPEWFQKFKTRHGILVLNVPGESKSDYKHTFRHLVVQWELNCCQDYKADKTALLMYCSPKCFLTGGDEKCAKESNKNKDRLIFMLYANTSGNHQRT